MSRKTAKITKQNPTTALCYIRLSWTRDAKDTESPDRQRSNILRVCEQNRWLPEFYEDAEGHKSGTTEKNRPGWLALKARLADPDIAALVANDLSRLHRKGWRIGDLLDFVDEHEVKLVLAAQGKQIDFSTPLGRLMVQVGALFDEWYAQDIGQRSRDSPIVCGGTLRVFPKPRPQAKSLPPHAPVEATVRHHVAHPHRP